VPGEIEAAFFSVDAAQIMSKWVGEAEQNVAKLFKEARQHPRCVIFIDEVEALLSRRRENPSTVMKRVVPQFLSEMQGVSSGKSNGHALMFMGATNEPWTLDEAAMRPGRLDERVFIPLPDYAARLQIARMNLTDIPGAEEIDVEGLAYRLDGYSGADINHIVQRAKQFPFADAVRSGESRGVNMDDFDRALSQVKPSVLAKMLERYERFAHEN
jgi:transitional endoplasmic reticulum ATPase